MWGKTSVKEAAAELLGQQSSNELRQAATLTKLHWRATHHSQCLLLTSRNIGLLSPIFQSVTHNIHFAYAQILSRRQNNSTTDAMASGYDRALSGT